MAEQKTVLFLCRCGSNIADVVDLKQLAAWAAARPDVAAVVDHELLCSPDGQRFVQDTLTQHPGARAVIAACSPRTHEKTFQRAAEGAGVNPGRVHLANIREHCAWVTPDRAAATDKAIALVRAALARCRLGAELERRSMEVNPDVIVIGGGIAGIEAALTAAAAGRRVTIIEREIALGGSVIKAEEIAPNMECAPCLLAPRLSAVRENPNITVISNADLVDVRGFYGNFTVRVRQRPRAVKDTCIGCEACFEGCPVEVSSRFHLGLGTHKAIYTLFPGSVPAAAAIDREACLHFRDGSCNACVSNCPFGAVDFDQAPRDYELPAGAIIVATGFDYAHVEGIPELGYGKLENVVTLPEFERLASSNGPTQGKIQRRNGTPPASVAVIHCAGSLRADGVPWCSGVCCLTALKVGALLRHQVPQAKVSNICHDLVLPGPAERALYERQRAAGTAFVQCTDLRAVRVQQQNGGLVVTGPGFDPVTADLVVLATGLGPAVGTRELAAQLNIDLAPTGYFRPGHALLQETSSSLEGIYVVGAAAGPCNLPTAITRGRAAAGDALSRLVPGRRIDLEMLTSHVAEDRCSGCKLCITVCPFKAISFDPTKKVSRVNEAICRGCGTCAASCSSGAMTARNFADEQVYAEIAEVLHE